MTSSDEPTENCCNCSRKAQPLIGHVNINVANPDRVAVLDELQHHLRVADMGGRYR